MMQFQIDFVVVGSFAEATCTVIGLQSPQTIASITLQHNGTEVVPDGRITISNDLNGGTSRLDIGGLTFSDAGEYTCSVTFQNPPRTRSDSDTLRVASKQLHSLFTNT